MSQAPSLHYSYSLDNENKDAPVDSGASATSSSSSVGAPSSWSAPAPAPAPSPASSSGGVGADSSDSMAIPTPDINLEATDLEQVAILFDAIRGLCSHQINKDDDIHVRKRYIDLRLDTFEAHVHNIITQLNDTLNMAPYSTSNILRQGQILKSKFQLYEICFQGLISHAKVLQAPMGESLQSVRNAHGQLFGDVTKILYAINYEQDIKDNKIKKLENDIKQLLEKNNELEAKYRDEKTKWLQDADNDSNKLKLEVEKKQNIIDNEREVYQKEKKSLILLIESLDLENANLKNQNLILKENSNLNMTKSQEIEHYWQNKYETEKKEWELKLKAPELDYHKLSDVIAQAVGAITPSPSPSHSQQAPPPSHTAEQQQQQQQQQQHALSAQPLPDFTQPLEKYDDGKRASVPPPQPPPQAQSNSNELAAAFFPGSSGATDYSRYDPIGSSGYAPNQSYASTQAHTQLVPLSTPSSHPSHAPPSSHHASTHTAQHAQQAADSRIAALASNKQMTQQQVKNMIHEIYTSYDALNKSIASSANLKNEAKKETLLQHMYTFLNHKFGLKSLIIDAANSLIAGLTQYANDHTIAVFGGILRHTLDEEFRHTEEKTKRSVKELLKIYLQNKQPLKRDAFIQLQVDKRVKGTLSEEEVHDIVNYMFSPVDRIPIVNTIKSYAAQQKQAEVQRGGANNKSGKWTIKYPTFVNILLDFQLHVHRKFLDPFVSIFRSIDTTHSGLLTYQQFATLVTCINPQRTQQEIQYFISQADIYSQKTISFSECVRVLHDDLKLLAIQTHKRDAATGAVGVDRSSAHPAYHLLPAQASFQSQPNVIQQYVRTQANGTGFVAVNQGPAQPPSHFGQAINPAQQQYEYNQQLYDQQQYTDQHISPPFQQTVFQPVAPVPQQQPQPIRHAFHVHGQ